MTDFRSWVPIRVYRSPAGPIVDWCFLAGDRFTAPFFDQTIDVALRHPFNQALRRQTPVEFLEELAAADPGLPPKGFVFHTSRCGSTLVMQMLAAVSANVVLSEPVSADGLLRSCEGERRAGWLKGLFSALGRVRFPGERHLFVKFDSWHAAELPLVRRAFPDVPWVFLYRDPVAVIASHLRQPGAAMVPAMLDPGWLGLSWEQAVTTPREEYAARAVGTVCRAALANRDEKALFVDYARLPDAVFTEILPHFGVEYGTEELARMREAARFDAKTPSMFFESAADREEKRKVTTDAARTEADRWVGPLLAELARQK